MQKEKNMKSTNDQKTDRSSVESKSKTRNFRDYIVAFIGLLSIAAMLSSVPAAQARSGGKISSCRFISGHIYGQLIGPNADLCPIPGSTQGALTEIGIFTDSGGNELGTFVACATSFQQRGDGALMFGLAHTYTTMAGDIFTTTDTIVASPIDPPMYTINNHAEVTGGTGAFQDALGLIHDHGTANLQTGVVSVDYDGRICTE
jgi:hypothetical protein